MSCHLSHKISRRAEASNRPRHARAGRFFQPHLGLCVLLPAVLLAGGGCRAPIGVDAVSYQAAFRAADQSALNGTQLSEPTLQVLDRYDLSRQFSKDPRAALTTLQERACNDSRRDLLCALAELNYRQGARLRSSRPARDRQSCDYYLTAAVYAYLFLFGEGSEPPPSALDPRYRLACDLYNRALAQGLREPGASDEHLHLASVDRALPAGSLKISCGPQDFGLRQEEIEKVLPADRFLVRGLRTRDRNPGLGAPLILVGRNIDARRSPRHAPATAFLRVQGDAKSWAAGRLTASLEIYSGFNSATVEVGERMLPLESDPSTVLAYALNDKRVWKLGRHQFFSTIQTAKAGIYPTQPYEPGRVPVIFVHGTASSPVWWAEMWNTLRADNVLRERCQFWCFMYNSGNPVSDSAVRLREAIQQKLEELDPEGKDPALRQMVLVGHSQGGLLAKLTATDTGDALWHTVTSKSLEDLNCSPEIKQVLRRNFFFERLPCVSRVVFIATPHRGSYLAGGVVRRFARWFVSVPTTIVTKPANWLSLRKELELPAETKAVVPTSIDGMSPKNRWLLALAELPPAQGVPTHSIIAIKGDQQPPKGSDGVVKYPSAHVTYAESEKIVRSGHSCQSKPSTIEEVRRILLLHLQKFQTQATLKGSHL